MMPDGLHSMLNSQRHRGPDAEGVYSDPEGLCVLGHNRLSIIDLSEAGRQPMKSADGRYVIVLNGEIYNYLELRRELESGYTFRTRTDTEVLLAAYAKWGEGCLDRLLGMFAFIIWDEHKKTAFVARDRFGVKPLYYHRRPDGTVLAASEIKALHAAGVANAPNMRTWAGYLAHGSYGRPAETFLDGVDSLPAGHSMVWKKGTLAIKKWYDLAERVGSEMDLRSESVVEEEYFELLKDSIKLRFRADVPVGVNLSGGLDSSILLGLVHEDQGPGSDVKAFTFTTGDADYDEMPWVRQMLQRTKHELVECRLDAADVPALAADVAYYQDEPFGGLPTLAYAKVFEAASERSVTVLLDGNGMDEQWAGYDYYRNADNGNGHSLLQGTTDSPVRPDCLNPEILAMAERPETPTAFPDALRKMQHRDATLTKIPRAMQFNDRISMRSSTELREPFLDHRLFELAMRQPAERKIADGTGKVMLRSIARRYLPQTLVEAPKRALQTPQREWLRGPLVDWADDRIQAAIRGPLGGLLNAAKVSEAWEEYRNGASDNSFYVWQWVSVGLAERAATAAK
jgi:asparagine synthase (glutamine-hydrolysing)